MKDLMWGFASFIKEYNIAGMAVAFVMGAEVAKWVASLVGDIVMPALLQPAMTKAGVANISELATNGVTWGNFLANTINFLVIAFIMYLLVTFLVKKFMPADEA